MATTFDWWRRTRLLAVCAALAATLLGCGGVAHVMVDVSIGEAAPANTTPLVALVRVEPLIAGEPSKDSTTAELTLSVTATPSIPVGNLLINPSFADDISRAMAQP